MPRVNCILAIIGLTSGLFMLSAFLGPQLLASISEGYTLTEVSLDSFNKIANKDEFFSHIEDMQRLKRSIMVELANLEQKRNALKSSVETMEDRKSDATASLADMEANIRQIKVDIMEMFIQQREGPPQTMPVALPNKLTVFAQAPLDPPNVGYTCTLPTCFDYSRCSVISQFPIYIYPVKDPTPKVKLWYDTLIASPHVTQDGGQACVHVVLQQQTDLLTFSRLPFWAGDGRNHIILNIDNLPEVRGQYRAIKAQISFKFVQPDFDIVLPHIEEDIINWSNLPLLVPSKRQFLLSFRGQAPANLADHQFISALEAMHSPQTAVTINTKCLDGKNIACPLWCHCEDENVLINSVFTIIITSSNNSISQYPAKMLYSALKSGTIPIILGSDRDLPLRGYITWEDAVIALPRPRITELVYILRNIPESDIIEFRKQGRRIFTEFLSSTTRMAETMLSSLRLRLGIAPLPIPSPTSTLIYNEDNPMKTFVAKAELLDETLGPLEASFPSPSYQRNFTSWLKSSRVPHADRFLFPHSPWDRLLPTDAKFHGSSRMYRPINEGAGGSGKEFSLSLGGNSPKEQFTVVILTYDRMEILQQQIAQFKGLPYLNKVIVVWNNPKLPDINLHWPDIGVPVVVIKGEGNSLNNRFIPFDEIETEAILSMDDDMYLRHDEIIFAFRVWRESRDRLVGFPGRYHAWNVQDSQWNYNSNHSCELSMVLTGAAFFHKYYAYQYTFLMPSAVREKVDEFMNCEDLAMNFLISHITGKPPIKVTSRWTFRCPSCGESSLWIDESHFNERHVCINYFIRVYGYLPLMYTQYRADSVLFKTRVPADKKKCFQFV